MCNHWYPTLTAESKLEKEIEKKKWKKYKKEKLIKKGNGISQITRADVQPLISDTHQTWKGNREEKMKEMQKLGEKRVRKGQKTELVKLREQKCDHWYLTLWAESKLGDEIEKKKGNTKTGREKKSKKGIENRINKIKRAKVQPLISDTQSRVKTW